MPNRTPQQERDGERMLARPVPDPDSLAMDDRGTRTYQTSRRHESDQPEEHGLDDDGNYIGDPIKPKETTRADDLHANDLDDDELPHERAPSDAPTIIRDVNRRPS